MNVRLAIGRRFARIATTLVVRWPALWRLLRRPMELEFDLLAPRWETIRAEHSLAPLVAALETVQAPRRALDLGAGTGAGAFAIAERFPDAEVVGVDLSGEMVAEARRKLPDGLRGRVQFEQADASCLPFEDGAFDLVVLLNFEPSAAEVDLELGRAGTWEKLADIDRVGEGPPLESRDGRFAAFVLPSSSGFVYRYVGAS